MKFFDPFLRRTGVLAGVLAFSLGLGAAFAAQPKAEGQSEEAAPRDKVTPPDRRELWVPMDKLGSVLNADKAVLLTREQYNTLLREAGIEKPMAVPPPREATVTSATYTARIAGQTVAIEGDVRITVLTDGWAEVELPFPGAALGEVKVDADTALSPICPPGANPPAMPGQTKRPAPAPLASFASMLLLRGKGEHTVHLTLTAPIQSVAGLSSIGFALPPTAAGSFVLALPSATKVETSALPVKTESSGSGVQATVALTPAQNTIALAWRAAEAAPQAGFPMGVSVISRYTLDAEKLEAAYHLYFTSPLGDLPAAFEIILPAEAKVLGVEAHELAGWEAKDGRISIRLQAGSRREVDFLLGAELPALGAAATATVMLPVPEVTGARRMEGVMSVTADDSVVVRDLTTDAALQRVPAKDDRGGRFFAASFNFASRPTPPRVKLERAQPKLEADLDTLVQFRTDGIYLERTITLRDEQGQRFSTTIMLPEGEDLLTVRRISAAANPTASVIVPDTEPEWRAEKNAITITWADEAQGARVFKLTSRMEPPSWTQLPPEGLPFSVRDAVIKDATKVTGYIALLGDAAFRLEAAPGETLERRDGRTTPVRGDYAWFRRDAFELAVRVFKRPAEVLAALTGYAVPLEGVLDLHATMNYQFLHGGARAVRLRVPREIAANFQFEGPQIAERILAGDIWTITFQKELTGAYALAITAQVPVPKLVEGDDTARGYSFAVKVPVLAPLDVARASGLWAVEANTETEISFEATGLNELDTLLAPQLPDYQPRHRVIGVFGWIGADYSLGLRGVRHAPATVLNTVVDELALDTVVSPGGLHRHQAALTLRTAGAQYLDIALPANAAMLSLAVDHAPVKPVTSLPGTVRVRLPAKREANAPIALTLLYETPGTAWERRGQLALAAPALPKGIPVLRSRWQLWLPDGFTYTGYDSNLHAPEVMNENLLVGLVSRKLLGEVSYDDTLPVKSYATAPAEFEAQQFAQPYLSIAPDAAMAAPQEANANAPVITSSPLKPPTIHSPEPQQREDKKVVQKTAGLLPVLLELPRNGRVLVFEGLYAPEQVSLHYEDWWSRARRLWFWFVAGGVVFYLLGRGRPWWRTVWATLVLSVVPLCIAPGWTPVCNALLGGWVIGLVLDRIAVRFVVRSPREVLA